MDCIIWACGLARTPGDELPPLMPGTSLQPDEIDVEEKDRIRIIHLDYIAKKLVANGKSNRDTVPG